MTEFDACIDLTVHNVPAGVPSDVAVSRVRAAVEKLPGAAWISVEWCGEAPESPLWLRLFKAGNGQQQSGGAWDVLADKITATMRDALSAMPPG